VKLRTNIVAEIKSTDFHVEYSAVHRHWHPSSEVYAGADALITALQNGWTLMEPVFEEEFFHAGTRRVTVYHATLVRGEESRIMPVITNPFIRRGMRTRALEVRPLSERHTTQEMTAVKL
jgi:hypothetical protein